LRVEPEDPDEAVTVIVPAVVWRVLPPIVLLIGFEAATNLVGI
jgi:hypothetical protein